MTDEIIQLKKGAITETLKFNETNLWFSSEKHKTIEKMRAKVEKNNGKFRNNHGIVNYKEIGKIKLNEKSEKVIVLYPNLNGKEIALELEFADTITSHKIGEFIASKTNLSKSISTENKKSTLLKSLLWPVGITAATFFIAFIDTGYETEGYSRSARRTRSGWAIIRLLRENIGQIGIIIIGLLLAALFLYDVWKRYNNPVNDTIYQ